MTQSVEFMILWMAGSQLCFPHTSGLLVSCCQNILFVVHQPPAHNCRTLADPVFCWQMALGYCARAPRVLLQTQTPLPACSPVSQDSFMPKEIHNEYQLSVIDSAKPVNLNYMLKGLPWWHSG